MWLQLEELHEVWWIHCRGREVAVLVRSRPVYCHSWSLLVGWFGCLWLFVRILLKIRLGIDITPSTNRSFSNGFSEDIGESPGVGTHWSFAVWPAVVSSTAPRLFHHCWPAVTQHTGDWKRPFDHTNELEDSWGSSLWAYDILWCIINLCPTSRLSINPPKSVNLSSPQIESHIEAKPCQTHNQPKSDPSFVHLSLISSTYMTNSQHGIGRTRVITKASTVYWVTGRRQAGNQWVTG